MKMALNYSLLALSLVMTLALGSPSGYMFPEDDDCLPIEINPNKTADDCGYCLDCGRQPGHSCCRNECGTTSCRSIYEPCHHNGKTYEHFERVPFEGDSEDQCGYCGCKKGKIECEVLPCPGE